MVIEIHVNVPLWYILKIGREFHEDMEYHDGPPKLQNGLLQPAQMDPVHRNHICNEAMIKFKI